MRAQKFGRYSPPREMKVSDFYLEQSKQLGHTVVVGRHTLLIGGLLPKAWDEPMGEPSCCKRATPDDLWICTRRRGHYGPHVGTISSGKVLAVWRDKSVIDFEWYVVEEGEG
jgi:hypothetical protein